MSKLSENPFAAFDFTKFFGDRQLQGFDPSALLAAQQKNFDAVAAANRQAVEGYQALVKRQAEIMQQTMGEMADLMRQSVAGGGAPDAAKQSELARQAIERAMANMKELAEMASKTHSEAFETINRRMTENLEELRGRLMPK
jgi:phasin family protein